MLQLVRLVLNSSIESMAVLTATCAGDGMIGGSWVSQRRVYDEGVVGDRRVEVERWAELRAHRPDLLTTTETSYGHQQCQQQPPGLKKNTQSPD